MFCALDDKAQQPIEKKFAGHASRRKPAFSTGFKINNIPLGRYRISAKLSNGKSLKMSLNKPKGTVFGVTPAETIGAASLLFHPDGAKASMAIPATGNWNSVEISLEMPK